MTDPDKEPPVIEHDADEHRKEEGNLPAGYVFAMIAVATAGYLSRNELPPVDWRDGVAMIILIALLVWCFRPRRIRPVGYAESHERTRQSIAFRLGKKLNHILHLRRRNAAVRD
jgi:hypothetical protein